MSTFLWNLKSLSGCLKGKLATPALVRPMVVSLTQRLMNIDTQRTPAGHSRTQKVRCERAFGQGKTPGVEERYREEDRAL